MNRLVQRFLNVPLLPWRFTRWAVAHYVRFRDHHLSHEGKYVLLVGTFVAMIALDVEGTRVYLVWSAFFGAFCASLLVKMFYRFPVSLTRHIPRAVTAGTTITYRVHVTNKSSASLVGLHLREERLPRFVGHDWHRGVVALAPPVGPNQLVSVPLRLHFSRRGSFTLPTLRVERFCPLGIMRSGRSFPSPVSVLAYPPYYPIERVVLTAGNVHQPGGVPLASSVGESTEFLGLREYRPGDQVKHLSWKAWARLGTPAVREFQSEYFKRVALVLDTYSVDPDVHREDFEAAVSTCASLAHHFEDHEYIVDLFAAGPDLYYLQAGRGLARLTNILEVLALVQASRHEPFPELDTPLRQLLGRLSGLVLVTTDWLPRHVAFVESIRGLVPQIKPVVVRRGRPTLDPAESVDAPELVRIIETDGLEHNLAVV